MRLQQKPNPWSCSVTAFAMALELLVADLIELVGHDGSEIVFPRLPEPMCRRGFHVQELVDAAYWLGSAVMPYELIPAIAATPANHLEPATPLLIGSKHRTRTFNYMVSTLSGVLTGRGKRCNHAMAFHEGRVFDPDGQTFPFSFDQCEMRGFYAQCVWTIHPIKN